MNIKKTVAVYFGASIGAYLFNLIYNFFGHGVTSSTMAHMWLYLLIGGVGVYTLLWFTLPSIWKLPAFRVFYNLYNAGLGTLILGQVLSGIFEIAGTAATGVIILYVVSLSLIAMSLLVLVSCTLMKRKKMM